MKLKTKDEAMRDMADDAKAQCEVLGDKLTDMLDGIDEAGEVENDRLCGITKDSKGRAMLVFAEPGERGRRTVVYVDSILALARLLSGEHQIVEASE